MNEETGSNVSRTFWITGGIALVWNLLGVISYIMHVAMTPEALAAMPEAERALYNDTPGWVAGVYAVAVFAGTLASILLLMRKALAVPLFALSLVAIVVQMGYSLLVADTIAVMGAQVVIMPLVVIGIGIYLLVFARSAKTGGILR